MNQENYDQKPKESVVLRQLYDMGVAAERERCAKIADDYAINVSDPRLVRHAKMIAAAIRGGE